MKIERTWYAADQSGFHMLHTLFQTTLKYPRSGASTNTTRPISWSKTDAALGR